MNEVIARSSQGPGGESRELRLEPAQEIAPAPGLFQIQAEAPASSHPSESAQEQFGSPEAVSDNLFVQLADAGHEGSKEAQSDDRAYAETLSKEPELPHLVEQLAAIEQLKPEVWEQTSLLGRLAVMLEVHQEVAQAYGFETASVQFGRLRLGENARYVPDRHQILFNKLWLAGMNSAQALRTDLHESRHGYEEHAIDHPETVPADHRQQEVARWQENMRNYTFAWDDPVGYRSQPIERDAEAFANLVVQQVLSRQQKKD